MPSLRFLRCTVAADRVVEAGEVLSISEDDARVLLALGKAVALTDPPPKDPTVEGVPHQTGGGDGPVPVINAQSTTHEGAKAPRRR